MRNERGFVYPLTLSLVFFSLLVILTSVNIYIRDMELYQNTNEFFIMENLILVMVQHSSDNLIEGKSDSFTLPIGTISYQIHSLDHGNLKVNYTCITERNLKYSGYYIYNMTDQEIVKWNEY